MKLRSVALVVAALAGMMVPPASAAAMPGCAPDAPGGEWRSYGRDLSNSRTQPDTSAIGPSNAGSLAPKWVFQASKVQSSGGGFSNTPIVADGCVYLASNTGWVFALNADTGKAVWSKRFTGSGQTLLGGVIVGSPVVANGVVYVGVSRPTNPYVAAMDQATGAFLWVSRVEQGQLNALINASPVYFDGMIFQGFAGNEGGSVARGGYAILDASATCQPSVPAWSGTGPMPMEFCNNPAAGATGGKVLAHRYTINDAEYAAGYRGASVWCTAAIDPVTKYAFACGGNPASKKIEARYSNALLKIDMDRTRTTFGDIVDAYKGDVDQYYPGLDRQPACDAFGDQLVVVWSLACLQLDLDFGSSPNLFTDNLGRLVLGDLQKSGVYHAIFADNMQRSWTTVAGAPCAACNAASPAVDHARKRIFTAATPPGQMVAMETNAGRYQWASPIANGTHFQPVATANGVVYTMDNLGALNAMDAETGVLLNRRPLTVDVGALTTDAGSAGVSIARNTIFAATSEFVVAYEAA